MPISAKFVILIIYNLYNGHSWDGSTALCSISGIISDIILTKKKDVQALELLNCRIRNHVLNNNFALSEKCYKQITGLLICSGKNVKKIVITGNTDITSNRQQVLQFQKLCWSVCGRTLPLMSDCVPFDNTYALNPAINLITISYEPQWHKRSK